MTEQMIEMFLTLGWVEQPTICSKYRKFINPDRPETFYWIGKAGAVRRGRLSSTSMSHTPFWKSKLKHYLKGKKQ